MTVEHFQNVLLALHQHQPFEPFSVLLRGGERIDVDIPVALGFRDGVAVFLTSRGGPMVFNHETVLQFVPAPSDPAS